MSSSGKHRPAACRRCKDRHLRCDGDSPCKSCRQASSKCDRSAKNFKFRHEPIPKRRFHFSSDQKWVGLPRKGRLHYVHVNPDGRQESDDDDDDDDDTEESLPDAAGFNASPSPSSMIWRKGQKPHSLPATTSTNTSHAHHGEGLGQSHQHSRHYSISSFNAVAGSSEPSPQSASYYAQTSAHDCLSQPTDQPSNAFPAERDHYRLGPLKGVPETFSDASYTSDLQEACLIRYFVERLAHWFDSTDRDRHFALTVPGRAMFCPVLRYALYTASAGHMRQALKCRNNINGTVIFDGIPLPGLSEDSAIRYHNICISYLIEISKDPNEDYNEDVLTAATILRFYEQIDAPSIGTDTEAYLKAVQFIVHTQNNDSFYAAQTIHGPTHDTNIHSSPAVSLRHSACLIALRQEIWSAFLHPRPVRLPISPKNDYNAFPTTCDFIWANRVLVWCADLLNFTFDSHTNTKYPTQASRLEKWNSLKAFETHWNNHKPLSYKPIYYVAPEPEKGSYFPTIWLMNDSQVVAEQHMELARILLAVSNPGMQRLGAGAGALNRGLEAELRAITRRVIGLGLGNRAGPPALVTSAVGISICGEYFDDPGEREALVRFLVELEFEYAWPTSAIVAALRSAWAS
ncbi:hypothetical protein RU639_005811 [Aspergillus parasiticus]